MLEGMLDKSPSKAMRVTYSTVEDMSAHALALMHPKFFESSLAVFYSLLSSTFAILYLSGTTGLELGEILLLERYVCHLELMMEVV
jgi:hypothetical protein